MSVAQLLGKGMKKSAATAMAASTADPVTDMTEADYPDEGSVRADRMEIEVCPNQPTFEMAEAKES